MFTRTYLRPLLSPSNNSAVRSHRTPPSALLPFARSRIPSLRLSARQPLFTDVNPRVGHFLRTKLSPVLSPVHPNHEKSPPTSLANTSLRSGACFCRGGRCHAHARHALSLAARRRRFFIAYISTSNGCLIRNYLSAICTGQAGGNVNPRKRARGHVSQLAREG